MTMFNRLIKLVLSLLYAGVYGVRNRCRRWFTGRSEAGRMVVLYYHAIPAQYAAAFERQVAWVVKTARIIPADYAGDMESGRLYVAITFDDAFKSVAEYALPVLMKHDVPACIFVPTGYLGVPPSWIDDRQHPLQSECVMSRDGLGQLPARQIILGSHGVTHPHLNRLSPRDAEEEMRVSRHDLELITGKTVSLFSFPYGEYSAGHVDLARRCGYTRVFSTRPDVIRDFKEAFEIGRVGVEPTDWPIEFRLKLVGAYQWMPRAIRFKRALKQWWMSL